jgi:integrase
VATNSNINGKDYYRIRKKIGEDINGKSIIKNFYGTSKKDAEKMYRDFEVQRKLHMKTENEYFNKLMHYWITEVFMNGSHASGTKLRYKASYENHILKSSLSNYLMSEVNSKAVQAYFNDLKADNTHSQIISIKKVLSLFFKYAETEGYCKNPMGNIAINKVTVSKREIVVFNDAEIKKLIGSPTDSSMYRFMFLLGLGTGLRQGELLGLKFGDIQDNKIKVVRQVVTDIDKKRVESNTKSMSGIRYVPIPESIMKELDIYKASKLNTADTDYIFCTASGKLIDKSNIITSWKRFLARIEVPYKEFHTLRRTYCTMLCQNGVPLQVACELMGHKDVTVTAKYYTFISNSQKEAAANKINNVLSGSSVVAKKRLKSVKRVIKNQG